MLKDERSFKDRKANLSKKINKKKKEKVGQALSNINRHQGRRKHGFPNHPCLHFAFLCQSF